MISDQITQHIAVLTVNIHIPAAASLKDKRRVVKSIKDRVRNNFNVSVAEVDGQDKWQVATLSFAQIGTDNRYMDGRLQNILSLLESNPVFEVCEHEIEIY